MICYLPERNHLVRHNIICCSPLYIQTVIKILRRKIKTPLRCKTTKQFMAYTHHFIINLLCPVWIHRMFLIIAPSERYNRHYINIMKSFKAQFFNLRQIFLCIFQRLYRTTLQALNCLPAGAVKSQAGRTYSPASPVASAIVPVPPFASNVTVWVT